MALVRQGSRAKSGDLIQTIPWILSKLNTLWMRITYPFASMGERAFIHYRCTIDRKTAHRIQLGNDVRIHKDSYLGITAPSDDATSPSIVIDDNCVIHWRAQIDAKNCIHIERDVLVTQDVLIIDHGHAYEDVTKSIDQQGITQGGRIRIGKGSWIAHGAAIICAQGELVLGENCVVAANAVVTRSAPAFSVLSGNPARVIKQYDPAKKAWVMGSARSVTVEK
jgi:acetyltransferase-like isoleucine patch superfamily enzyme